MKKICIPRLIFLFICLVLPVQALCSDVYQEASALINAGQYDNAIELLSGPCSEEPLNLKLNILLANAQVEKCALLKRAGDETYKTLIMQPYRTAVRLHKAISGHPELYYIAAKCLWINDSRPRAKKTINKALRMDAGTVKYYLLKGDICCEMGEHADENYVNAAFNDSKKAYQEALSLEQEPIKKRVIESKLAVVSQKRESRLQQLLFMKNRK